MRIRQSYLGTADDCLRKLEYQMSSTVRNSGSARAIGTGYHAGLETLYRSRLEGTRAEMTLEKMVEAGKAAFDVELEEAGETFIWDENYPDAETAKGVIEDLLTIFWNEGHEWPEDWIVLGVEHQFEMEWMGHTRTGTIDLVMLDPNGWVVAEDHKTSGKRWPAKKEHPRKNNQAPWYIPMIQQAWPGAHGYRFVFGVMTYKGVFERRISDPKPEHVQAVEVKALQVATLVDGMAASGMSMPANPSSNLCSVKYCDFWNVCPHGAILDT